MSEEMTAERIARILAAFEAPSNVYCRSEVEEAVALRDEITPALLEVLGKVAQDPITYASQEMYSGHQYAVELLSFFREPRAHPVILELFSMPEEVIDPLFGDIITEDLPIILYNTCGGVLDGIKGLLTNSDAYLYCRLSAGDTLVYATVDGLATWEETMGLLAATLSAPGGDDAETMAGGLVYNMARLGPGDYIDVIRQAYADDTVDVMYAGLDWIESMAAKEQGAAWQEIREDMARRRPDNVHDLMVWWAGFEEPSAPAPDVLRSASFLPAPLAPDTSRPAREIKAAKKKARKQAKASRRRNRK